MKRSLIAALAAGTLLLGGLTTAKADDGGWIHIFGGIPVPRILISPPPLPTVVISPGPYHYGYRERDYRDRRDYRPPERRYDHRYRGAYGNPHWRPYYRHDDRRDWGRGPRWGGGDDH